MNSHCRRCGSPPKNSTHHIWKVARRPHRLPLSGRWRYPGAQRHRNGFVLVAVLAALFIVLLMLAGVVKSTIIHRQAGRAFHHQEQLMWVAESSLQRAAARRRTSAQYTGERWEVDIDGTKYETAISVEPEQRVIRVTTIGSRPGGRIELERELLVSGGEPAPAGSR